MFHAALAAAVAAGCARVGPTHAPPAVLVPTTWGQPGGGVSLAPAELRTLARWWTTLDDPVLTSLIARAVQRNLDVRQAHARVREARARRGLAGAQRWPAIDAHGSAAHSRDEDTGRTLYAAGFDAAWEVDVFGRQQHQVDAATASLQARIEEARDVLVTLASEVALNYIDVRVATARLVTARANLRAQIETHEIARFRFQAGLTTQIDVDQALTNVERTRAAIPVLQTSRVQAIHRLGVLLGRPPSMLASELAAARPIPIPPVAIAVGVPADMLRRRPDVRRAERELAAQTAQVGAAVAERYPRLTLSGSIGLEALAFGDLLSAGARALAAAANVAMPVFDAGRIRHNIAIQTALQEQAALAYEASVLAALEDVENALVAYAEEQVRRDALVAATDAARSAAELAEASYRAGLIDFQVVLDAQRSLLTVEDQLAVSTGAVASNVVRLYKALGGGWPAPGAGGR